MKSFEAGSKKRKNDFKDKYQKDKSHSNKNISEKENQIDKLILTQTKPINFMKRQFQYITSIVILLHV